MLAGLILAPIGHWAGYRPAMIFAAICGVLAAIAIEPTRRMLDAERDRTVSISIRALLRWSNLTSSIRAITHYPGLLPVTFMALSLSVIQGSLFTFTVTYLVARGLDLAEAGTALACLQLAGVTGRIVLGWLADRTGKPIRNLVLQSFAGALFTVFFGLIPNGTSLLLAGALAALTGFVSAGWNGIFLSEIARLSPPDRVAEATSAANVVIFLGYASSPATFTALIAWTGSWTIPFMLFAGQLALMGTVQGVMLLTGRHPSVNLRRT